MGELSVGSFGFHITLFWPVAALVLVLLVLCLWRLAQFLWGGSS